MQATPHSSPQQKVESGHLRRAQQISVAGLFLLACTLYITGMWPSIAWRDAPEFVTVAHTLGIGHPSGSPTYSLFTKLVTFLPFGSIALRVNFGSAVVSAISIALLFMILYELLAFSSHRIRWVASLCGSLFLLVSESFWRVAQFAEVYALQNCVLAGLILLLIKARDRTESAQLSYYWTFAFLYGLSAGIHATMALFAPAFLGFIALTQPRLFLGRAFAFLAFFFLLGFSTYLYLPLRSLANPAFDWGDPQTLHQFLIQLLDRKDSGPSRPFSWSIVLHQWRTYLEYLPREFSVWGTALGILGFICTARLSRRVGVMLILIFLGHVWFFANAGWAVAWGFIPSYVIFSVWIGFGVAACLNWLTTVTHRIQVRLPRMLAYACILGGVAASLVANITRHAPIVKQTQNYSAVEYGKHLLDSLPPDAILFCEYSWFPLLYLQQVEQRRPDLTFILHGEIFAPQYFAEISQERHPNIRPLNREQSADLSVVQQLIALVQQNEPDHPLFWEPEPKFQGLLADYFTPHGFLYALNYPDKAHVTPDNLSKHWQRLSESVEQILGDSIEEETRSFLSNRFNSLAHYFRKVGLDGEAARSYTLGLQLKPHSTYLRHNYGKLLMTQKQYQQAAEQLQKAYALSPIDPALNRSMGTLMLHLNADTEAISFFKRALDFGGNNTDVYAQLGAAYLRLELHSEAQNALQTALDQLTAQHTQDSSDTQIANKINWVRHYLQRAQSANSSRQPDQAVH